MTPAPRCFMGRQGRHVLRNGTLRALAGSGGKAVPPMGCGRHGTSGTSGTLFSGDVCNVGKRGLGECSSCTSGADVPDVPDVPRLRQVPDPLALSGWCRSVRDVPFSSAYVPDVP